MDAPTQRVQANPTEQQIRFDHMASTIDGLAQQLADSFGQLTHHLDEQHAEFMNTVDARLDRMATMIDKLVARVETNSEERTALGRQVQRHKGWIQQVATEAGIKLSYER